MKIVNIATMQDVITNMNKAATRVIISPSLAVKAYRVMDTTIAAVINAADRTIWGLSTSAQHIATI